MREFLSYAVGCMFGRYSLDTPGLILASQGEGVAEYRAKVPASTFKPDEDNIIPVLDGDWFHNDVTLRFRDFLRLTFGDAHFNENLAFIEGAIGKDVGKFFTRDFFADHLKRYKKRPIYWLFSSGKEQAFQCLVYMHRYNEATLARMRTDYVNPLQSKIASRIEQIEGEKTKATSTSHSKRLQKEQDDLRKQEKELRIFEEKLRHVADQRIVLDLDDGVKANYGRFGDLLAEVKAVTGGKDEE
jgi:type II restriction/modification system DNA methylase subunit YeeA